MITVEMNPRALIGTMTLLEEQLPFATSKALNECAKFFQAEEKVRIGSAMTIRRPWVLEGVKIERQDFATKQKLAVRVHIDEQRDFLDKFEEGGTRVPRSGKRSLSVPVNVRRTKTQIIAKQQRPKSFQFSKKITGKGFTIFKGERGTFLIQRPDGRGVILQRTRRPHLGPSRHGDRNLARRRWGQDPSVNILWALRPTTPVPKTLRFFDTAKKSFLSSWPGSFKKWYIESLRTAR